MRASIHFTWPFAAARKKKKVPLSRPERPAPWIPTSSSQLQHPRQPGRGVTKVFQKQPHASETREYLVTGALYVPLLSDEQNDSWHRCSVDIPTRSIYSVD